MSKKIIKVRLYTWHDYDLIYLYKNLDFPIKKIMKEALISYVRDQQFYCTYPIKKNSKDLLKDSLSAITCAQLNISFDEDKDYDLLYFLKNMIKKRCINSFLKNMLRSYLIGPSLYVYQNEPDYVEEADKHERFLKNLKTENLSIIEPEKTKKTFRNKKYMKLTKAQKNLLEQAGAIDDTVNIKIIKEKGEK